MTTEQSSKAGKIYLDSNIIIYFVEGTALMRSAVRDFLERERSAGTRFVTSDISIAECLFGAFKRRDRVLADAYRELLGDADLVTLISVTPDLLEQSAALAAQYKLKTIDAIHVASSAVAGCRAFITNDRRLRTPPGIDLMPVDAP